VAEAQLDGEIDEERAVWLIVGLLSASIDTTGSTLHFTLSFIADHPEIQSTAHTLLSTVCGTSPPNFSHKGLEYLRAIVKESTRMWPVSPTGMPRCTDKDDVYNGYFIPKGTTVLMNLRYVQLSETEFMDAGRFWPERWLTRGDRDLGLSDGVKPFGTGRRICPGIYVATDVMYMLLAHILWAFNVSHKHDRGGMKTVDDPGFGSVIVGPACAELVFEGRGVL
ncbi:cytochrome P450, partial [Cyathus striatus]